MAHFVLIHGAAHGAWCWRDVLPSLQLLGHKARAIDLPSHGDDPTPAEKVTLDDYANAILAALKGPTIVVGHSMAGYPIARAAEMAPDKVAGMVYLCAYTPWPGLGMVQMRKLAKTQPLREAIRVAPDGRSMSFDPEMVKAKFYHDCPPGTLDYALPRLTPQGIRPMETPVDLHHTLTLPRSYIICNDDRAIPPELQRRMAAKLPPENVYEMETSHSPFFTAPDRLALILDRIAKTT